MLHKNDLLLLLSELQDKGQDVSQLMVKVATSDDIPLDALKLVNTNKQLDVVKFYEMLRKQNNDKKSKLYKNIVKDISNPDDVLTTLSALNLQILLYGKHLENPKMFYSHVRAEELTRVLNNYYKTFDLTSCLKLLNLYKADIFALEYVSGKRK